MSTTVEQVKAFAALHDMWWTFHCPEGVDPVKFKVVDDALKALLAEHEVDIQCAIYTHKVDPSDEPDVVTETEFEGLMSYDALINKADFDNWICSSSPMREKGSEHDWLVGDSWICPHSGVETWESLHIVGNDALKFHLHQLLTKAVSE